MGIRILIASYSHKHKKKHTRTHIHTHAHTHTMNLLIVFTEQFYKKKKRDKCRVVCITKMSKIPGATIKYPIRKEKPTVRGN